VDDSLICRHEITEILQADGQIEVVGEGSRGEEALTLLDQHQPDMLVVDLVMPGQGGQETIALVMAKHPLPILVLTAQPEGVRQVAVFDAIRRGALDLAEKPRRGDRGAEEQLRRSICMLAHIPVVRHVAGNLSPTPQRSAATAGTRLGRSHPAHSGERTQERATGTGLTESDRPWGSLPSDRATEGVLVVGIGASAGGPTPLATLLGGLPKDFPAAITVVQHLPVGFTDAFVEYLRGRIALAVKKVEGREPLRPGFVYLANDDQHLALINDRNVATVSSPPVEGHRPSVDVLFESLAKFHGRRGAGIILSGIGQDGVRGLLAMRNQGALTIAQSEESCAVFGMPQAALNFGAAQLVLSPEAMSSELQRYATVQTPWGLAR
jgi:two-component system, chemotaxis family, protein-glutamate methylesterase/glutaminase